MDTVNNFRRIEQMVPDDLLKYGIISLCVIHCSISMQIFTEDHIVIIDVCHKSARN